MKRPKVFLALTMVAIASAATFAKSTHNYVPTLFYCGIEFECELTDQYTDIPNGEPITPPYALYQSNSVPGEICGGVGCRKMLLTTKVYIDY